MLESVKPGIPAAGPRRSWGKTALRLFLILVIGPIVIGFLLLGWAAGRHDKPEPVPGVTGVARVRNLMVDIYAARTGDGVVLFDAGIDARGRAIDDLLRSLSAERKDVRAIFLTHGHPDHVAAVPLFRSKGVRIYVGAGDAGLLDGSGGKSAGPAKVWKRAFGIASSTATDRLEGRREVELPGGEKVLALPFPGHTEGSTLYLLRGVLFAGDAFNYHKGHLEPSPEKFADDAAQARHSLTTLTTLLQGLSVTTICTGHGGCTPPGKTTELVQELARQAASP
jgi:glyoxylase-like metal-dependent hydrolase (beta-lactamase superfamily II)